MTLQLNKLSPAPGAKKNAIRVGRGIGSGMGKTAGRGHKGQKARKGGGIRTGFEGGQMPLYRRIPKFGFTSRVIAFREEVRLSELNKLTSDTVSLETLKQANIVRQSARQVKLILSGSVDKPYTIDGVKVTKGAKAAIESAGGSVI